MRLLQTSTIAALVLSGCTDQPYKLGEAKALYMRGACSIYEQAFANDGQWKGDPWWEVYVACERPEGAFSARILKTRYPDLYKAYESGETAERPTVTIEYCQYRSFDSYLAVEKAVADLYASHDDELEFLIAVRENMKPCDAIQL